MFIEGIFLQGDLQNRNGRMYPMSVLRKEVQRYNENHVKSGRALGELGHPEGPTVNLDRVSHKIVSLKESGSNFIGKAKLLSTPMGKIASSLIEEGVKLGVSSRGIGSLKPTREGVNVVGDDFMIHLLLMLLLRVLWKEKNGFGMEVFLENTLLLKLIKKSILLSLKNNWMRRN